VTIVRIVLTAVVGIGASVAAAASIPSPHTVQDLAAAITAKGLGCQDFQPAAPPLDSREGTCTVGHEFGVSLDVFASHRDLVKRMPKASAAVCTELRKTHSSVKIVFVVGSNWVAVFESKVNAGPLARATGAKVQPLKC
jgi:hypothetical protein